MKNIKLTPNLAWGLVIVDGIIECFWVLGLKYADTLFLYALTGIGIFLSFACMILAIKVLEIGVAYSVFLGIGTAGVTLSEIFIFNEPFSPFKILFIVTLLIGVVGLKLCASERKKAEIKDNVQKFISHSGLDEVEEFITDTIGGDK